MVLNKRHPNELIPKYSLTGDLLSFLRCELQYRYHNGSSLPPSRPVQLWFGEFIHGILEVAFRLWKEPDSAPLPWPINITPYDRNPPDGRNNYDIGAIGDIVEATLRSQGKIPRSSIVRESAYKRAEKAVNELGPHLFPLISAAEERVIGTRDIPHNIEATARADKYELHGIIDVVTDIEFTKAPSSNLFKQKLQEVLPTMNRRFEVLVDYKGSRRPATNHEYWAQGEWQLQTYAWLREKQPGALPVVAGILLYINELAPTEEDLKELKKEVSNGNTDILPQRGSNDYYLLTTWQPGNAIPEFSFEFRFARAVRIVITNHTKQEIATSEFDKVVAEIERCVDKEATHGRIIGNWRPKGDSSTCVACDFRHFCPNPAPRQVENGRKKITAPNAP